MCVFYRLIGSNKISLFLSDLVLAKSLFQAVDQNHNGSLDFTDLMALTAMINKLSGQFGGGGLHE